MRIAKSELKSLRSLAQKKFRDAEKKFLLEGWRALKDALNSTFKIELVVVLSKYLENSDYKGILQQAESRRIPVKEISEVELKQISDTVHSQGVVALVQQKSYRLDEMLDGGSTIIVLLDGIADPGNAGSIVRTADWFGAGAVLMGKGSVEVYNDKVVRSTAGSIFHVPVLDNVDIPAAIQSLKQAGFHVAATAAEAKTPYLNVASMSKLALVLGSEARGVSPEVKKLSDAVLKIPKYGEAESLNVGVACGIILAHFQTVKAAK